MSQTILILGKQGQLAQEIYKTLQTELSKETQIVALSSEDFNFFEANEQTISLALGKYEPTLIINAAAYTKVDLAENDIAQAFSINGFTPELLALYCKEKKIAFIHFSTDYVFDGQKNESYLESDATNPQSIYGKSKDLGEKLILAAKTPVLIFRTSWVYSNVGQNFYLTMLKLFTSQTSLRVVRDQIGTPTSTTLIAQIITQLINQNIDNFYHFCLKYQGIYHLVSNGQCSWHDFAKAIFELASKNNQLKTQNIQAVTSEEYIQVAQRPKRSVLSTTKIQNTFQLKLPSWEESLMSVYKNGMHIARS